MADGKIYITISDKRGGSGGEQKAGAGTKHKATDEEKAAEKAAKEREILINQAIHNARQQAKQIVSYQIGNIGNFTGDFNSQREVEQFTNIASAVANIGIAFATNWVAGVAAVVGTGISFAEQEYANYFAVKKQNYAINQLRDISGLNALTNGSR